MGWKFITAFRHHWTIITLLLGLIISAILAYQVHQSNKAYIARTAKLSSEKTVHAVIDRIHLYQYGLHSIRGVISAIGTNLMSRSIFYRYSMTRDLHDEFPGAKGVGFIRRVAKNDVEQFVADARKDGWLSYDVKEFAPNNGEKYLIQYIEPVAINIQSIGLDIASEPNRYLAAKSAMETGQVRLTGPITLVQAKNKSQQSFLILMPIYQGGKIPLTQRIRETLGFGWAYAPLVIEDVLADLDVNPGQVQFDLYDVTDKTVKKHFYSTKVGEQQGEFDQVQYLNLYGRVWESHFRVYPSFIQDLSLPNPFYIAGFGALFSILSAALVGALIMGSKNREEAYTHKSSMAAIVESSMDAIIGKTLEGRITSWNQGAERLFGYKKEEAIGHLMSDLLVPVELYDEERRILEKLNNEEEIPHYESKRKNKAGANIPVSVTVSPIYGANGKIIGASTSLRNISEQKAAEDKIKELNANLENQVKERTAELQQLNQSLLSTRDQLLMSTKVAKVGVWSWELKEDHLEWDDTMFDMYQQPIELKKGGLTTYHWKERLHPEDKEKTIRHVQQALEEEGALKTDFRLILPNGSVRYIEANGYIEKDEEGRPRRLIGVNRDITDERALETWLRQAKEEADAVSEAKTHFLANMSHEIRTPMNAVIGMLELVRRTKLSEQQEDYISKAQISAKSLLNLINDILDYSKVDAGKLELEYAPFKVEKLLYELSIILSGNQKNNEVELIFDIDNEIPDTLMGDQMRLQQVLINLLSNALKFTLEGQVTLSIKLLSLDNNLSRLAFSVKDTGIGIAKEQQEHIFDVFSQAESSTARRFGGSGLGLVICRRIVELMGGNITLDSELGVGSRFYFTLALPVADVEEEDSSQKQAVLPEYQNKINVLVVDDNAASQMILMRMIDSLKWQGTVASSGEEAIEQLTIASYNQNKIFDVVLLDWRMPNLDGLDVANIIHSRIPEAYRPKVIIVSGHQRNRLEQDSRSDQNSFVDYLHKPVTLSQLRESIHRALSSDLPGYDKPNEHSKERRNILSGLRLLLVEDNLFNRQVAAELLSAEGAEVSLAESGLEGVSILFKEGREAFDLVLMDMQMPGMDGLEATKKIRSMEIFSDLPIIAMTANVSEEDRKACLLAGMNDHIGKPIDVDQMVTCIKQYTHRTGTNTVLSKTVQEPSKKEVTEQTLEKDENKDTESVLLESVRSIIHRFGGNADLYISLVEGFNVEASELLNHVEKGLKQQDQKRVREKLHALKGSTLTMGLERFSKKIARYESRLKHTDDPVEVQQCFDEIQVEQLRFEVNHELSLILKALRSEMVSLKK